MLNAPSNGGAQKWRIITHPVTPPYNVLMNFFPTLYRSQYSIAGVGFRDSVSGKFEVFRFNATGGTSLEITYETWTDLQNNAGVLFGPQPAGMVPFPEAFFRLTDDNTNRIISWSTDGENWIQFYSQARTTFMTANQVLFGVNPYDQVAAISLKGVSFT